MKNLNKWIGFGCVVILVCGVGWIANADKEISMSQVPQAVKTAIEKYATGGKIVEVILDKEDGETLYEAVVLRDGKKTEYEFSSSGQLLEEEGENEGEESEESDSEREIQLSDAPAAVQVAFQKAAKGNPILKVEQETDDDVSTYEADFEIEGVKHSVKCAVTGEVMELENEVNPQSLPKAVLSGLNEEYPGAVIDKAESVMLIFYEVEMKKDGKTFEVKVSASGDVDDDDECDRQDEDQDKD